MPKRLTTVLASAAALLIAGAGCAQTPDPPAADAKTSKPPIREHASTEGAAPAKPAKPAGPVASDDLLNRMASDLAQRLGAQLPELRVVAVEPVVWSDGALGCPQPGQSYVAAQTPRISVQFERGGKTYQYHGSERGHFVYCTNPAEPVRGGLETH
jgi:hypothetical protein